MTKLKKEYNKIFDLLESKKFEESFEVAIFRTRLSNKIRQSRINLNISQDKFSKMAQTTQRIVSEVENGNYNMGVDFLYKILKSLGKELIIDGEDLITGKSVSMISFIFSSKESGNIEKKTREEYAVTNIESYKFSSNN